LTGGNNGCAYFNNNSIGEPKLIALPFLDELIQKWGRLEAALDVVERYFGGSLVLGDQE
jgi:hypothetical protein